MNLLKGKKTYLTAAAAIIFALVLFFLGQLGGVLTALFILGVAIAVFLRQGINDLAKKIEQETKKDDMKYSISEMMSHIVYLMQHNGLQMQWG